MPQWIINQIPFWWVVSFCISYFHWYRKDEHWGVCIVAAFVGAGFIEMPILLGLQVLNFVFSYLPAPEHFPHWQAPSSLDT